MNKLTALSIRASDPVEGRQQRRAGLACQNLDAKRPKAKTMMMLDKRGILGHPDVVATGFRVPQCRRNPVQNPHSNPHRVPRDHPIRTDMPAFNVRILAALIGAAVLACAAPCTIARSAD